MRQDGHAHHESAAGGGVVWVEVGEVGEVNGGRVVDLLQSARGVEVADRNVGLLLSSRRALRLLDCGAEGAGASDLVGRQAGDELLIVSPFVDWMIDYISIHTSCLLPLKSIFLFLHSLRRPAMS